MHLLKIQEGCYPGQADPFILKAGSRYYIYVTGHDAVYAYHSDCLLEGWQYHGQVLTAPGFHSFWAPSVIELDGEFYMYHSMESRLHTPDPGGHYGAMYVSVADSPLGPFTPVKRILPAFSIDSHIVRSGAGLFLFYSANRFEGERIGTCIYVDKMLDPFTPAGNPVLVVEPTLDEEIYQRDRYQTGQHWHTVEGAFYFRQDDWQYVMYSGNCFESPTYYVGFARAKTDETDLTKIRFRKYPDEDTCYPVLKANEFEEGTGHHSMIFEDGRWYAVYHARDYGSWDGASAFDARNARICVLEVKDGVIAARRFRDHI